jgi:hypothetical protein
VVNIKWPVPGTYINEISADAGLLYDKALKTSVGQSVGLTYFPINTSAKAQLSLDFLLICCFITTVFY